MASITSKLLRFQGSSLSPPFSSLSTFNQVYKYWFSGCLTVTSNVKKPSLIKSLCSKSSLTILLQTLYPILGVVLYCVVRKKAVMTGNMGDFKSKSSPFYVFLPSPHLPTLPFFLCLLCILRIMLSIRDERDEKHNGFILKELTMIATVN